MCGIFGYIGHRDDAKQLAINGLKKLEYRGYDSWGVAYRTNEGIKSIKELGKISTSEISQGDEAAHTAIAHTRWATHGKVTIPNCHPHVGQYKEIYVVQNGIIENYAELREELKSEGKEFHTETDTEVIPHLIEKYLDLGFVEATKKTIERLEGCFAILVLSQNEDFMITARRGPPLIIGKGENEMFVASDIPAFLEHTKEVMYLDDNEYAVINKEGATFYSLDTHKEIEKRVVTIDLDIDDVDKGDFKHFMLKEIMDQKETIYKAINQEESEIEAFAKHINNAYGTIFTGCGTAGKVAQCGEYFFAKIAQKHINQIVASEFASYHPFLTDKTLMVAISQSGETADVLEAIKVAKSKNVHILSILNADQSTIMRQSDTSFLINAGPEQAVASTKATTAQLALLMLLAYASAGKLHEGKTLLLDTAAKINDMLNPRYLDHIRSVAENIRDQNNIYIIGKAENFPIALESAIKIQEVSYIHAEGFAAGELKHGPIALIHDDVPCIAFVPTDENRTDVLTNCMEIKARGAKIIGVSPENNDVFDIWIKVPDCDNASPIVNIIPIQILSYYLAVSLGKDPDKPRNLAKSVTVK